MKLIFSWDGIGKKKRKGEGGEEMNSHSNKKGGEFHECWDEYQRANLFEERIGGK